MLMLTFYGHANFLLDDGKYKVLVDPWFTGNPASPTKADQIQAQYILVTHGHGDHLGDAIDIAKRCDATIITNHEIAHYCSTKGAKVHGMHIGGKHDFDFGRVRLTTAHHGSAIIEGDRMIYGGNPCGFLIQMSGKSIYHAGDTGLFRDMELINLCHLKSQRLDVALLPIGDNYVMGPEDAIFATKWLHPRYVVPMHYNTFPLLQQDGEAFKKMVHEGSDAQCQLMEPGDSFVIK
ncbi:metal-dependent hydrolase [Heliorestis convoluta]|uniref:UPF0173 metal-dependent hydrolase FTV88_3018 n=1 Tax=Heliorestis convoluta TaxID=356322 RepID=A0A5Q2N577_9FIRM|nr:metal-dependent hydrolase [Heliorestis convoluta]QGG49093.1 metal-dependent hydrolase [Heliorestis convoluta]